MPHRASKELIGAVTFNVDIPTLDDVVAQATIEGTIDDRVEGAAKMVKKLGVFPRVIPSWVIYWAIWSELVLLFLLLRELVTACPSYHPAWSALKSLAM